MRRPFHLKSSLYQCLSQLLICLYLLSTSVAVPIDFQVGNYLHKFFQDVLPNNTNYRRKPGDEEPYKKYYSKMTTSELPNIEGLSFKYADNELPTLPMYMGNVTFGTYKFNMESTMDTTPNKECMLKVGQVFRDFMMQKSGLLKNIAGAMCEMGRQGSTDNPDYKDLAKEAEKDYKEMQQDYDVKLEETLRKAKERMEKRVEAHWKQSTTESTGVYQNFIDQFKAAYMKQVDVIANATTAPHHPGPATSSTTEGDFLRLNSAQEAKDREAEAGLAELEKEFITRADFEAGMTDIYTPGPHESWG